MSRKARSTVGIKGSTLVVGIDVAKERHVAVAEHEGEFTRPLGFGNDRDGFEKLAAWIERERARCDAEAVMVGLEPTGVYDRSLVEFLCQAGYGVRWLPTVLPARLKDAFDQSALKTDAKDAALIAKLTRQGEGWLHRVPAEVFDELRALAAERRRRVEDRTRVLNQLRQTMHVLFPELSALFKDWNAPTLRALLRIAATPQETLALGLPALTERLRAASRGRTGEALARQLLAKAERSVGAHRASSSLRNEVAYLLDQLDMIDGRVKRIDDALRACLVRVPYGAALASIPALGEVTVAALLGELGDLRGYQHVRQVIKKCGLSLTEKSSGKQRGRPRTSKRGRPGARWLLYLAAIRMFPGNGVLAPMHGRMLGRKAGPQIAVAGMRKLLRMMFAIARDGRPFDAGLSTGTTIMPLAA